ncbi:MAG: ATP-binding cassette domain-containing protein [Acidimicrobiales bacterium]
MAGLIVLYLGYPIAGFVVRLIVSPRRGFHAPGLFPALWVSICGATISLALVTLLGVPLAYRLARSKSRIASVIGVIVMVPLALPPLMSGIVLVYLIGPYTFLGQLSGERLTDSMFGLVIAMSFVSAPFLIVAARAAFSTVDQGLLDVARTLGHSDVSRFFQVAVPGAGQGIRAGMLLTWLRAFGEYGAVVILAYNPASLPIYTYNQFSGRGLPTTLAPTALALAVAVAVVMISRVKLRLPSSRPTIAPAPRAPEIVQAKPVRFEIDHHLGSFHLALTHDTEARHLAVLGPSGSGKSALLRCLAGLYGPGPGPVWYGDDMVRDVPVERRGVGYVAQGFSLFPHLSVWRHLMFAEGATPELAAYWIDHLQLEGLESRLPSQLSGGQCQRVGLAQVLCRSPHVLLLDEPFSALDAPVRSELRRELRHLQLETGLATVLVTHDPEEAALLSDEVMVIARGALLQSGSSRSVFARPASLEVARLLGIENLNRASVASATSLVIGDVNVRIPPTDLAPGTDVFWSVPPERIVVSYVAESTSVERASVPSMVEGVLTDIADTGRAYDFVVECDQGTVIRARTWGVFDLSLGDRCRITWDIEAISISPVEATAPETLSSNAFS